MAIFSARVTGADFVTILEWEKALNNIFFGFWHGFGSVLGQLIFTNHFESPLFFKNYVTIEVEFRQWNDGLAHERGAIRLKTGKEILVVQTHLRSGSELLHLCLL